LLVEQKKNSGLKNEYFHPNPQIETGSEKRIVFGVQAFWPTFAQISWNLAANAM